MKVKENMKEGEYRNIISLSKGQKKNAISYFFIVCRRGRGPYMIKIGFWAPLQ